MGMLAFIVDFPAPIIGAIIAGILFIAIIALLLTPSVHATASEEKKIAHQSYYVRRAYIGHALGSLKRLNPASTLLMLTGLSGATFYGIIWFVIPILIAHSVQSHALSFGLAIFDFSVLVVGYLIGRLTDRWSKRWLVFWGLLLFAVMAFLIGFNFGWLFIVFGFLATTGDEMASISLWAWMDHLDKEHSEDALVTGLLCLAQDLGWTIGPVAAGILFQFIGPSWTIACGALLIFLTWIIAALWTHHIPAEPFPRPALFHAPRRRRHKR